MGDAPENSGVKHTSTRWKPGQSGNPLGRPKGVRHKAVEALDLLGRNASEEIVLSVIASAKTGDARCAELVLRRIWPEVKTRPVMLDLPAIADAAGVLEALAATTQATAAGEITPDEASALAGLVEAQRRAVETDDLAERVAALEERNSNGLEG